MPSCGRFEYGCYTVKHYRFFQFQPVTGTCYVSEMATIAHYSTEVTIEASLAACTSKCDATPDVSAPFSIRKLFLNTG